MTERILALLAQIAIVLFLSPLITGFSRTLAALPGYS